MSRDTNFVTLLLFGLLVVVFVSCSPYRDVCHETVTPCNDWIAEENVCDAEPLVSWWELFDEPALNEMIGITLCNNYRLKAAFEKVVQSMYLRGLYYANFFPSINGNVNAQKSFSQFAIGSALFGGAGSVPNQTFNFANGAEQKVFLTGFDATWQVDIFGHNYQQLRAACFHEQALLEAYRDVKVSLAAEVANHFFYLRWNKVRKKLLQEQQQAYRELIALRSELRDRGVDNDFPILTLKNDLEVLSGNISVAEGEIEAANYSLATLQGFLPSDLDSAICSKELSEVSRNLCIGVPSTLLRRRPDIRQAESIIAEASSEIGVAVTEFYPSFTLSGMYGYETTSFVQLLSDGPTWLLGSNIIAPIFRGGYLKAQLQQRKSEWREAVFTYYDIVVNALNEAESSLSKLQKAQNNVDSAKKALTLNSQELGLSMDLTQAGINSQIDFINVKITNINSRIYLEDRKYEAIVQAVALYKALGGGWQ